jgi:ABC-type dipeptide/oligopeptide/nickel transport system ATPase component
VRAQVLNLMIALWLVKLAYLFVSHDSQSSVVSHRIAVMYPAGSSSWPVRALFATPLHLFGALLAAAPSRQRAETERVLHRAMPSPVHLLCGRWFHTR